MNIVKVVTTVLVLSVLSHADEPKPSYLAGFINDGHGDNSTIKVESFDETITLEKGERFTVEFGKEIDEDDLMGEDPFWTISVFPTGETELADLIIHAEAAIYDEVTITGYTTSTAGPRTVTVIDSTGTAVDTLELARDLPSVPTSSLMFRPEVPPIHLSAAKRTRSRSFELNGKGNHGHLYLTSYNDTPVTYSVVVGNE